MFNSYIKRAEYGRYPITIHYLLFLFKLHKFHPICKFINRQGEYMNSRRKEFFHFHTMNDCIFLTNFKTKYY